MNLEHDAAAFFDGFAASFDTLYTGKRNSIIKWVDRTFRNDMFVRFALSFKAFGELKGRTVLDIGCGSGPYVLEALQRGAHWVTAVDPAPNMLALLRHRLEGSGYEDRCHIVDGAFPGVDVTMHDHIIVMGVMDYIADGASFMSALLPLAEKSAVVSFPSKHWLRSPIRRFRYRLRRCPLYLYDEDEIRDLCAGAGFRDIRIHKIYGAGMDYHVCLGI